MANFYDIVKGMALRVRTVASLPDGMVRVVIAPSPGDAPYRAEAGVHFLVGRAAPYTPSGAGRHAYRTRRTVYVAIVSECLLDVGGRDDEAVRRHLVLEDQVIDCVHDYHPDIPSADKPLAEVSIKWADAQNPERLVRTDEGLVSSVLGFEVIYRHPFDV